MSFSGLESTGSCEESSRGAGCLAPREVFHGASRPARPIEWISCTNSSPHQRGPSLAIVAGTDRETTCWWRSWDVHAAHAYLVALHGGPHTRTARAACSRRSRRHLCCWLLKEANGVTGFALENACTPHVLWKAPQSRPLSPIKHYPAQRSPWVVKRPRTRLPECWS